MVLLLPESDPIRSNVDDGDLFEFCCTAAMPDMCAADDVITGGKLLPLWIPPPPPQPQKAQAPDHRRSNSLGDPPHGCWGGKSTSGGEYRKLRRVPDPEHKETAPDHPRPRPRWYVLVFGSVRVPAAMELKEMRVRQRRRSAPPVAAKDSGERGPWRLLRSLSCKGMETTIIA